jgi:cleavage and polyadenylation specificity factor subunit 1
MLSKIEEVGLPSPIDFQELAKAQENDDKLKQILKNNTALNLRKIQLPNCSYEVYCDDSNNKIRPYVPPQLRAKVFRQFQNVSHPGIRASKNLVNKHFVWPKMNIDLPNFARSCINCQKSKTNRHTKSKIGTFLTPGERFDHIHIDLVGPLPISEGYRYVLTVIDRYSRWPEAIPLVNQSAESVARALHEHWVCRFGVCRLRRTEDVSLSLNYFTKSTECTNPIAQEPLLTIQRPMDSWNESIAR